MEKPKETQEGLFIMKWRNFIPMMISVIIGTNTFSIFHQKQNHNAEQIKYNKERSDRINKRLLEEAKNHYLIEELKKELEQCKESKK